MGGKFGFMCCRFGTVWIALSCRRAIPPIPFCGSQMATMDDENVLLQLAVEVYRSIPEWGTLHLDAEDALISVGMKEEDALSEAMKARFHLLAVGAHQRYGSILHVNSYDENCRRAVYIAQRMKYRTDNRKQVPLAHAMLAAGFSKEQSGPGKEYMRVSRALKSAPPLSPTPLQPINKQLPRLPTTNNQQQRWGPRPPPQINIHATARREPMISPLSVASSANGDGGIVPVVTINGEDIEIFNSPPLFGSPEIHVFGDENSIDTTARNLSLKQIRKRRQANIKSDISHLTTTKDPRRTTHAAQVERQTHRELDNIRKSMYKAGTMLYKSVQMRENTLTVFQTAEDVARALNNLSGIDCISGRELTTAVRTGNVGKSPPRLGRKGEVPEDVFKAFCDLVFTACAIEQANCSSRSTREQLKSCVGEILNSKRQTDGLEPMNDSKFYSRIEKAICHLQDLNKADSRESLRILWLTYQSQLLHYKKWEEEAVRLGFARPLNQDESSEEVGFIVWDEQRLSHVLQFDEMNVALDGADSSIGGRESKVPTATGIGLADAGTAAEKSGAKMTIMFGLNFAGEALPPLLLFPSHAKNPANYKLKADFAKCLPQVEAIYGFDKPRAHNIPFAMNPKGSMTKEMLNDFFERCVLPLYPDCADTKESSLLIKVNSGPGRLNPPMLRLLRSRGAHLYPGMPNGTEVGQECDQVFSYLKKLVYENRQRLWQARFRLEGESASLSMSDVTSLVFGGSVTMIDGSSIELENAFTKALDKDHIHEAMDKCGYCPSTRQALKATQIRHEIVESEAARKILLEGKDAKDLRKPELAMLIQWKQGANPAAPNNEKIKVNKPVLLKLWNEKYSAMQAPDDGDWTEQDEERLDQLRTGDITCFSKDVGLERCMETEDDYLATRLLAIASDRRESILLNVLHKMKTEEAEAIISSL
ncbi:unknown protein [Seminavis robusta]|uniref:Uncharacterized protein n=1 Tax=Seminavis robusta TaxID=568900 RepID=A0A9N8E3J6_9STRA|nr:unknown protein [Seminavis robusta]|eukprot:Sro613_g175640.1 n/a (934) ;mRNA; r:38119-41298